MNIINIVFYFFFLGGVAHRVWVVQTWTRQLFLQNDPKQTPLFPSRSISSNTGFLATSCFFCPYCLCSSGVHHLSINNSSICNESTGCNCNLYFGSLCFETCQLRRSWIKRLFFMFHGSSLLLRWQPLQVKESRSLGLCKLFTVWHKNRFADVTFQTQTHLKSGLHSTK